MIFVYSSLTLLQLNFPGFSVLNLTAGVLVEPIEELFAGNSTSITIPFFFPVKIDLSVGIP